MRLHRLHRPLSTVELIFKSNTSASGRDYVRFTSEGASAASRSSARKSSSWCLLVFGPRRERTVNQHVLKIRVSPIDTHGFVTKKCFILGLSVRMLKFFIRMFLTSWFFGWYVSTAASVIYVIACHCCHAMYIGEN